MCVKVGLSVIIYEKEGVDKIKCYYEIPALPLFILYVLYHARDLTIINANKDTRFVQLKQCKLLSLMIFSHLSKKKNYIGNMRNI